MSKPFILITGMHRSGTSFLARALNLSGVYLGSLESLSSHELLPKFDNMLGHWENKELQLLGETFLKSNNSSWDNPASTLAMDSSLANEITNTLNKLYQHISLASGYKDPRVLIYFNSWKALFPQNTIIIGIFRHPVKVAHSLMARNGFDYTKSLRLWTTYNRSLLEILQQEGKGFLLSFDWPKDRIVSEIRQISTKLGLFDSVDLSSWYSDTLIHEKDTEINDFQLDQSTLDMYHMLEERADQNVPVTVPLQQYTHDEYRNVIGQMMSDFANDILYIRSLNQQYIEKILQFQKGVYNKDLKIKELEEAVRQLQERLKVS